MVLRLRHGTEGIPTARVQPLGRGDLRIKRARRAWDGTYGGALTHRYVCVWRIDLTERNGKKRTVFGHVNLLRWTGPPSDRVSACVLGRVPTRQAEPLNKVRLRLRRGMLG